MLDHIAINRILFIDIETVPQKPNYEEVDTETQKLWGYRTTRFKPEEVTEGDYYFEKAGVYAEFGKLICISVGFFAALRGEKQLQFRVKSFYSDDEQEVLMAFLDMLNQYFDDPSKYYLCGHHIKEFDVPFLCRRLVINGLPLPKMLNVARLKPWEIPYIDTLQIWKFGDYRNYTSLHLLTHVLGIPNPKKDMEGHEVAGIYWQENDLNRIQRYCQQDVIAVARLILKFKGLETISDDQIIYVD